MPARMKNGTQIQSIANSFLSYFSWHMTATTARDNWNFRYCRTSYRWATRPYRALSLMEFQEKNQLLVSYSALPCIFCKRNSRKRTSYRWAIQNSILWKCNSRKRTSYNWAIHHYILFKWNSRNTSSCWLAALAMCSRTGRRAQTINRQHCLIWRICLQDFFCC